MCECKDIIYTEEDFEEGIVYTLCLECGKEGKAIIIMR
jgi:hypothetical protein